MIRVLGCYLILVANGHNFDVLSRLRHNSSNELLDFEYPSFNLCMSAIISKFAASIISDSPLARATTDRTLDDDQMTRV
jgi:hypothetical protein